MSGVDDRGRVERIIRAINKGGRQGPRDLESREVYDWIKAEIGISYEEYADILSQNSIPAAKRGENRDGYFLADARGVVSLFKSNEQELRPLICYILSQEPGLTSDRIIYRVKMLYNGCTPVDRMLQENLSSPQEIIDQVIRNILTSNYHNEPNRTLFSRSIDKPYTFELTDKGRSVAEGQTALLESEAEAQAAEDMVQEAGALNKGLKPYSDEELRSIAEQNKAFTAKRVSQGSGEAWPTDGRLKLTCKSRAKYLCNIDKAHSTFVTPMGDSYCEAHHILPMAAQKAYPNINLDCAENIAVLCPTCHRAIHFGSREVKKALLEKLIAPRLSGGRFMGLELPQVREIVRVYYRCGLEV